VARNYRPEPSKEDGVKLTPVAKRGA